MQLESAFLLFLFKTNYLEHWKMLISELSGPIQSIQNIYSELQIHFFFQVSVDALQCLQLMISQKNNYFVKHLNSEHVDEVNYLIVLS